MVQPLCMLACWVEDPNGDAFKKHLARIEDYIWVGEDGIKMQVGIQPLVLTMLDFESIRIEYISMLNSMAEFWQSNMGYKFCTPRFDC